MIQTALPEPTPEHQQARRSECQSVCLLKGLDTNASTQQRPLHPHTQLDPSPDSGPYHATEDAHRDSGDQKEQCPSPLGPQHEAH